MTKPQDSRESEEPLYSIHDAQAQQEYVQVRRANQWVGFFLPHLCSGMSVLDCGCGVGSITLDLAELVAPGQVIGIDVDESQLQVARLRAEERNIKNVRFEVADVYHLNYESASFDAVLAHTLLMHLQDRLGALRDMRRVLKPGGVIGVSDDDYRTFTWSPSNTFMERLWDIWASVLKFNGGDPYYSHNLRGLLREAGFVKTEGHAVAADYYGTLEETRRIARIVDRVLSDPVILAIITDQGFADLKEVESLRADIKEWAEGPDAFFALMYCAAVGWNAS